MDFLEIYESTFSFQFNSKNRALKVRGKTFYTIEIVPTCDLGKRLDRIKSSSCAYIMFKYEVQWKLFPKHLVKS